MILMYANHLLAISEDPSSITNGLPEVYVARPMPIKSAMKNDTSTAAASSKLALSLSSSPTMAVPVVAVHQRQSVESETPAVVTPIKDGDSSSPKAVATSRSSTRNNSNPFEEDRGADK